MCDLCRRSFMRGTAALLGAGALPTPLLAQAQTADSTAPASLPARGDFIIRNGYVLTMEAALGDIPRGSVHVRNGGKFRAGPLPENVYRTELEAARSMGIPVTVHIQSRQNPPRQIEAHAKENLLGKDIQLVHAVWATPDELKMVKDAGATISIATTSDLRIGFGLPPVSDFLAAGIPCGISVDTSALIGSSSLFGVMRNVRDAENARTLSEFKLTARRVLELATIEGARSLGIDDRVGSLRPGKRADIVAVTTQALNMGGFVDAAHLLVGSALPL
jgi:5-methylthioadenosine/S-adenosylhomocysteine deaminase